MENSTITLINYKEAANLLNISSDNIRYSASKDILTRITFTNKVEKYLIKEQVLLFADKKRISLRNLSSDETKQWEYYKQQAENYNINTKSNKNETTFEEDLSDLAKSFNDVIFKNIGILIPILIICILAMGISWVNENKEELVTKGRDKIHLVKKLDEDKQEEIANSLKEELDTDTNVDEFLEILEEKLNAA